MKRYQLLFGMKNNLDMPLPKISMAEPMYCYLYYLNGKNSGWFIHTRNSKGKLISGMMSQFNYLFYLESMLNEISYRNLLGDGRRQELLQQDIEAIMDVSQYQAKFDVLLIQDLKKIIDNLRENDFFRGRYYTDLYQMVTNHRFADRQFTCGYDLMKTVLNYCDDVVPKVIGYRYGIFPYGKDSKFSMPFRKLLNESYREKVIERERQQLEIENRKSFNIKKIREQEERIVELEVQCDRIPKLEASNQHYKKENRELKIAIEGLKSDIATLQEEKREFKAQFIELTEIKIPSLHGQLNAAELEKNKLAGVLERVVNHIIPTLQTSIETLNKNLQNQRVEQSNMKESFEKQLLDQKKEFKVQMKKKENKSEQRTGPSFWSRFLP